MGFFGSLVSAAVKVVVLPVAVAKDVVNVVRGEEVDATKTHVDDIVDDFEDILGI